MRGAAPEPDDVRGDVTDTSRPAGAPAPFEPPPYPYDRLNDLRKVADQVLGGCVDLSIGTPCDPPPAAVVEALARSNAERGYPPSVREIGQAVGLTSPSTVHSHLATLQRRGYLHRDPTKPRAIEVRYDPNSGKAMEVQGASTADGGRVVQYTDWGGANQQWQLARVG